MKREEANKLQAKIDSVTAERDSYKNAIVTYRDIFKHICKVFREKSKQIADLKRELSGYHLAEDIFRDQKKTRNMHYPETRGCDAPSFEDQVMSKIHSILNTGQVSNVKH